MSPQIHLAYSDSLERQIYNSLKSNRLHETQAENPCICWEKSKYGKARVVYLGSLCKKDGWQGIIHRRKRCDLSLFQLGIRLLEHFLNEGMPIPVQFHIII